MKILLINPPSKSPSAGLRKCHPPIQLLYLAAALEAAGHTPEVLDMVAKNMTAEQAAQKVAINDYDLVGFSIFSDVFHYTEKIIRKVHSLAPETPLVVGGVHASADPIGTMKTLSCVNFLLKGEAEYSLVKLANALATNSDPDDVPSLIHRSENGLKTNPDQIKPFSLDNILPPAFKYVAEHFEKRHYYSLLNTRRMGSIITTRGCPFRCNFCYCSTLHSFRALSAEKVIEEILQQVSDGRNNIEINDNSFLVDRDRAMQVFKYLIEEGSPANLFFKSRVSEVDTELLRTAKKAGTSMISFGMESGNQQMLDRMGKGITLEMSKNAMSACRSNDIRVHTGWIIGYPGETLETITDTEKFIKSLRPFAMTINLMRPYPGTPVFEEAAANGTLEGSWADPKPPWIKLPWISSKENLERIVNKMYLRLQIQPYYVGAYLNHALLKGNIRVFQFALRELYRIFK